MNPDIQIQQVMEWAYNFVNLLNQPGGAFTIFCILLPALSLALSMGHELFKKFVQAINEGEFEEEKRKNEKLKNEDLVLEEKPKRGRMMLGDDGELLEIVEEEFEE
jgi:hypothetical protein